MLHTLDFSNDNGSFSLKTTIKIKTRFKNLKQRKVYKEVDGSKAKLRKKPGRVRETNEILKKADLTNHDIGEQMKHIVLNLLLQTFLRRIVDEHHENAPLEKNTNRQI